MLDTKGLGDLEPRRPRRRPPGRGRAQVERALGPPTRIENVLEALLVETRRAAASSSRTTRPSRRDPNAASTCATSSPTRSTPTRRRTSTTRSRSAARPTASARGCTSPTSRTSSAPGTPLDRGAARRAFSTYVPGLVAPMLPHELADDLCSLRPHQDRLCVTVEIPPRRRAVVLPLGDPLATRGSPTARRSGARRRPTSLEALELERRARDGAAREALRARRAAGADARGVFRSTATAASPTRGSRASRTRTCSSRS